MMSRAKNSDATLNRATVTPPNTLHESKTPLNKLDRRAFIWTIVWVNLTALLIGQLVLRSIPEGDTVFVAVDVAAITFVLFRLKRTLGTLRAPQDTPDQ
jgi:hypothetical protein